MQDETRAELGWDAHATSCLTSTARYLCSTTDNSTSTNPGLHSSPTTPTTDTDHGHCQVSTETSASSITRDTTQSTGHCQPDRTTEQTTAHSASKLSVGLQGAGYAGASRPRLLPPARRDGESRVGTL